MTIKSRYKPEKKKAPQNKTTNVEDHDAVLGENTL